MAMPPSGGMSVWKAIRKQQGPLTQHTAWQPLFVLSFCRIQRPVHPPDRWLDLAKLLVPLLILIRQSWLRLHGIHHFHQFFSRSAASFTSLKMPHPTGPLFLSCSSFFCLPDRSPFIIDPIIQHIPNQWNGLPTKLFKNNF